MRFTKTANIYTRRGRAVAAVWFTNCRWYDRVHTVVMMLIFLMLMLMLIRAVIALLIRSLPFQAPH
ncbi:MAG: hypothetical protein JWO76_379 [Nocardioides sp.]|nr:hypothetical protein [Nocardioides sp.]